MKTLLGFLLILVLPFNCAFAAKSRYPTVTLQDLQFFNSQPYGAFMTPWCKGALQYQINYTESMIVHTGPSMFPVQMSWSWPDSSSQCGGIYGFNSVQYGNFYNTPLSIVCKQVRDIGTLQEYLRSSLTGQTADFNVIDDVFLTSSPGNFDARLFEIEIFHHSSKYALSYFVNSTPIGSFTTGKVNWKFAIDKTASPPDILIMPDKGSDTLSSTYDIKSMLTYLMSAGVLTGSEYFNGLAFGVEPGGSGSLAVTAWDVKYN